MKNNLKVSGSYIIRKYKAGTKELISESSPIKNLVVSSSGYGRNLIARALSGDTTYSLTIDSAKIGTSSTAVADAQTDLIASVLTITAPITYEVNNDTIVITVFIPDANLANGTYNEWGMFADGQMFARSIITPALTKGSNQDVSVEYTLVISP